MNVKCNFRNFKRLVVLTFRPQFQFQPKFRNRNTKRKLLGETRENGSRGRRRERFETVLGKRVAGLFIGTRRSRRLPFTDKKFL